MSKKKVDTNTKPLDNLRCRRKEKGYSQQAIAELLDIGQDTYSDYELGKTPIPSNILVQLADILKVSCDYILGMPNAPLNIGNKEIGDLTGLNETAIEMLRALKGSLIEDLTANYLYPDLYGVPYNPIGLLNILFSDPNIKGLLSAIEEYMHPVYDTPMYVVTAGENIGGTNAVKMDYHVPTNQVHKKPRRDPKGHTVYDNYIALVRDENSRKDYHTVQIDDAFLKTVSMRKIQEYIDAIKKDYLAEKSVQ